VLLALIAVTVLISGCSSGPPASTGNVPSPDGTNQQTDAGKEPVLQKARLIEGWYAKGEDGGYFSALQQGYYKELGVDLTIQPGGPQISGMQLVASGKADFGYANYCDVLFTTEDYLKRHPDIVKAVVQATQKGWSHYLENYKSVNPFIQTYNKDMTVEAMNYEAEQQKEFILNEETKANGIGYMTMERWNAVQDQLLEIKGLKEKQDVSKAFTTEFLKKP